MYDDLRDGSIRWRWCYMISKNCHQLSKCRQGACPLYVYSMPHAFATSRSRVAFKALLKIFYIVFPHARSRRQERTKGHCPAIKPAESQYGRNDYWWKLIKVTNYCTLNSFWCQFFHEGDNHSSLLQVEWLLDQAFKLQQACKCNHKST